MVTYRHDAVQDAVLVEMLSKEVQRHFPVVVLHAFIDGLFIVGPPIQVARACASDKELAMAVGAEIQPAKSEAQGLLLQYWAHPRVGYWLCGGPPEPMVQAAELHDSRTREALCIFSASYHGWPSMGMVQAAQEMIEGARAVGKPLPGRVPEADAVE
ncbi:hypothetical protein CYMTET_42105 [Cymbomonas tetramitiformis]|uniref:Uncharacterized protein n=1 Tax=Cymbomonas tetramitiformis TaxID=36881 RepID=A0AAE0C4R6_9CHLO|nr:hypothetical protein CYMTET_42105 [Cymbomonas tetramitiformis]